MNVFDTLSTKPFKEQVVLVRAWVKEMPPHKRPKEEDLAFVKWANNNTKNLDELSAICKELEDQERDEQNGNAR